MRTPTRKHGVAALLAATALVGTACSAGGGGTPATATGSGGSAAPAKVETSSVTIGDAAASTGPAAAEPGSRTGGTVTVYEAADMAHLDPAEVYPNNAQAISMLFTRQLTTYKKVDGKYVLVGDLATDTGATGDGGKTWTFTLKDGVKFDDGTPVTSKDVKYGIERLYDPGKVLGPKYVPQWLSGADYTKAYKGPNKGGSLPDSVVETPDDKTIVFHLQGVHAEFPFAVAMPYTSPVQKSKDGKSYDNAPVSTGPYKIEKHDDTQLTLVRNENWDPATDPVRHNYPDRWEVKFGLQSQQATQQFVSDVGQDKNAVSLSFGVDGQFAQQVQTQEDLKARLLTGINPYVYYYAINTSRVTDLNVRKAILTAFPKEQVRQIMGGPTYGDLATTILSPTVQGFEKYDLYNVPPSGDPEAAKKLLAGATPTIVYAYQQSETSERAAVAIQQGLEKAGFKVVKKPISSATWYDQTTKKDNGFDLYFSGWASDWPGGSGFLPALFDGRTITDGTYNYARFNDDAVNAEIDRISAIGDVTEQNKQWMALDKKLMEQVPVVPFAYLRSTRLYGSNVGAADLDIYGATSLVNLFLKS
ncbi:ABC transporter substrate-binding protein [Microtetraspora sp. AC03309]|uniref:ABC transporter substrate-binding protein n=1 Tax=Microtetraspora sp. AC03309 TaxID=2779376 RepID=UPI001E4AB887|nr:ABC transporter substrate-binding protein [Microtetraspora sp. AC03309]MCC5576385.1 ABC transporter substrate-binding protein [Microtetraspora sp. AC03309]